MAIREPTRRTLQPLAITLTEFRTVVCTMSRASANIAAHSGELPTFLLNGRRMVTMKDARAYVARKAAAGGTVSPEEHAQKSAAGKKGRRAQLELARGAAA